MNVIIASNIKDASKEVTKRVEDAIKEVPIRDSVLENTGFVETVMGKMMPRTPDDVKDINPAIAYGENYSIVPIDESQFKGKIPKIEGLVGYSDLKPLEDRKRFIHNGPHAAAAYLGYIFGHKYIADAIKDPRIRPIVEGAMREAGMALVNKYGSHIDKKIKKEFSEEAMDAHIDDLLTRFENEALEHTVARVGEGPKTKLGHDERLVGAAIYAKENGVEPVNIVKGIAAGILYNEPGDAQAVEVQNILNKEGLHAVIQQVCGLDPNSSLAALIGIQAAYLATLESESGTRASASVEMNVRQSASGNSELKREGENGVLLLRSASELSNISPELREAVIMFLSDEDLQPFDPSAFALNYDSNDTIYMVYENPYENNPAWKWGFLLRRNNKNRDLYELMTLVGKENRFERWTKKITAAELPVKMAEALKRLKTARHWNIMVDEMKTRPVKEKVAPNLIKAALYILSDKQINLLHPSLSVNTDAIRINIRDPRNLSQTRGFVISEKETILTEGKKPIFEIKFFMNDAIYKNYETDEPQKDLVALAEEALKEFKEYPDWQEIVSYKHGLNNIRDMLDSIKRTAENRLSMLDIAGMAMNAATMQGYIKTNEDALAKARQGFAELGIENAGLLPRYKNLEQLSMMILGGLEKPKADRMWSIGYFKFMRDNAVSALGYVENMQNPQGKTPARSSASGKAVTRTSEDASLDLQAIIMDKAKTLSPFEQVIEPESLEMLINVLETHLPIAVITADSKYNAIEKEIIDPLVTRLQETGRIDLVKYFHLIYAEKEGGNINQYCRFMPDNTDKGYKVIRKSLGNSVSDKGMASQVMVELLGIKQGTVMFMTDGLKDEKMFNVRMPQDVRALNVYVGEEDVIRLAKSGVLVSPTDIKYTQATRVALSRAAAVKNDGKMTFKEFADTLFDRTSASLDVKIKIINKINKTPDVVIWDWDRTIFDTDIAYGSDMHSKLLAEIMSVARGGKIEDYIKEGREYFRKTQGITNIKRFTDLIKEEGLRGRLDPESYRVKCLDMIKESIRANRAKWRKDLDSVFIKEALPVCETLHNKGVLQYIVSSNPWIDKEFLEYMGFNYFTAVYSSASWKEGGEYSKDVAMQIISRAHPNSNIMAVGDGRADIVAGNKLRDAHKSGSVYTVALVHPENAGRMSSSEAELREASPDALIYGGAFPSPAEFAKAFLICPRASASGEVSDMIAIAPDAAAEITKVADGLYTLMMPFNFYKGDEFNNDLDEYRSRFNNERVGGDTLKELVENIIKDAKGREEKTVALIPKHMIDETSKDLLKSLADLKIRFIIADITSDALLDNNKDKRHEYRSNAYAIMLLTRHINEGMEGSSAYRMLEFYLTTHFGFSEKVAVANYIEAIKKGDIIELIKGWLAYRPAERYDAVKEYNSISASLIFA
ncbi:MAG: hypothetical protein Q7S30_03750 [Candidatus Omnitrophota bacterium]|nr:hypothetical protein [Candidatus Omnitrophota bacterium]